MGLTKVSNSFVRFDSAFQAVLLMQLRNMRGVMSGGIKFLLAILLVDFTGWTLSFSVGGTPRRSLVVLPRLSSTLQPMARHSEFSVVDEDSDDDEQQSVASTDYVVVQSRNNEEPDLEENSIATGENHKKPEYGAMSPGTVVQVQIGDLALARKAWKKRRRTGSPLLVPCSILNVDHRSMVRWNLMFLLEKFGKSRPDGIEITGAELSKSYRTFLRSSLQRQSEALGFESSQEMILELFNKKIQESYGIRLVEKADGTLALKAPMSRTKAQKRAARTPILQFRAPKPGDQHFDAGDTLTHTGFLRSRQLDQDKSDRSYHFLPLSAALRVSQKDDVDTGRIEEGSIHPAVVFDYDVAGDAGAPLLTLSLNPRGIRENLKVKPDRKYEPIENPRHVFQELKVGDGPFRAKVVRLKYDRALIDMDVGRKLASEGMVKVFGTLRFRDSVELASSANNNNKRRIDMNDFEDDDDEDDYDDDFDDDIESALFNFDDDDDEDDADEILSLRSKDSFEPGTFEDDEEEEDISDQFEMTEDGVLSHIDPVTGKTTVLMASSEEEYYEDEDDEDDEDDDIAANIDDDDIDFDMTTLFEEGPDGTVSFIDPDSGEALEVDSSDEEYEDMMMIKSLIDEYSRPPSPKNVKYTYSEDESDADDEEEDEPVVAAEVPKPAPTFVSKRLRMGEEVDVYVRAVSKQNGQFTVTMNPTVQGRKAKDLKKESSALKKLDRLKKSLGGSLQRIWELEGKECGGIVKATSPSGEWVYVQPELSDLPVGVATLLQGVDRQPLVAGDSVRVRIAGVDEQRGQLAMGTCLKNWALESEISELN